jgi:phosphatidylglycerol---prolipoprotein diacylglyceryl transferase
MFNFSFDAVIFHLGSFAVRWYLVTEILAICAFIGFALIEARRLDIPRKNIPWLILGMVVVGVILAKIADIIGRPENYISRPAQIFSPAGMRLAGLLFGAFIVKLAYSWKTKTSFWRISDVFVPGMMLASAIFRTGCFVNGCCFGLECSTSWLAVTYSGPNSIAPANIPLYPVQLFQVILSLMIFFIVWFYRKKIQPEGSIYLLYVILFAAGDFIIRLFRHPDAVFLGIQIQQILNISMLLAALPLIAIRRKNWVMSYTGK